MNDAHRPSRQVRQDKGLYPRLDCLHAADPRLDSDSYVQLAYFDGKLVALRTENLPLGPAPATRYCTKIVWGVLEN